jgi:hypothetical protein
VFEKTAPCGDYPPDGIVTFSNFTIEWDGASRSEERALGGRCSLSMFVWLSFPSDSPHHTFPHRTHYYTPPPLFPPTFLLPFPHSSPQSSDGSTPVWTTGVVDEVCDFTAHIVSPSDITITWNTKAEDPSEELIAASQANKALGGRVPVVVAEETERLLADIAARA